MEINMMSTHWKTYLTALIITAGIFGVVIFVSGFATDQKIRAIQDAQDLIALDITSSETQFSLLSELSCKNIDASSLSQELNSMESKIQYTETNKLTDAAGLLKLKKFYFLLEIKDFLLLRKINERCGNAAMPIVYIYTNDCSDCVKQGYVLTALQEKYPELRVYSFDYGVDLSALHALLSIYKVQGDQFPVIIIGEQLYSGFKSFDDIEKTVPPIAKLAAQQKLKEAALKNTLLPATSTPAKN